MGFHFAAQQASLKALRHIPLAFFVSTQEVPRVERCFQGIWEFDAGILYMLINAIIALRAAPSLAAPTPRLASLTRGHPGNHAGRRQRRRASLSLGRPRYHAGRRRQPHAPQ